MQTPFTHRMASARAMLGLSLQGLADLLGNPYNKQLLSRLESGSQDPNGSQLSDLGRALHKPVDFFMKPLGISMGSLDFRKTLKVGKKVTERIKEVASDYLERYLELEDLLGLYKGTSFPLQEVKLSKDEINWEAKRIRTEVWNVGMDPLGSIIHILESQGIKVLVLEKLEENYLDVSFSGFSTIVNDSIGFIVINGNPDIPMVRKRFTLLHEFAHLYLNLEGMEHKPAEKLCDALAGAILVPQEALIETFGAKRTNIHISELKLFKADYGVSLSAIVYGLYSNQIISPSYMTSWMVEYNKRYRKQEVHGYMGEEGSKRFMQLLMRALTTELISESKAAALNNQKTGEFLAYLDNLFMHEDSHN